VVHTVGHAVEGADVRADAMLARRLPRTAARSTADGLRALQRLAGNRAVAGVVASARRVARVEVSEVQSELKRGGRFAEHYPAWLTTKRAVTGKQESELLRYFTLAGLKAAVEESAVHQGNYEFVEKSVQSAYPWTPRWLVDPAGEVKETLAAELSTLASSATLKRYASERLGKLGEILKDMQVLDPSAFEQHYFKSAAQRGLPISDPLATIDFARGYTVSRSVCLRLGSGANLNSIHTAVHEVIHALSDPFAPSTFGHHLNEGVTELITQRVMREVGPQTQAPRFWQPSDTAYLQERGMVERLMQTASVSLEDLIELYFATVGGSASVTDAVQSFRDGVAAPSPASVPQ
jgi:hypothetical protein